MDGPPAAAGTARHLPAGIASPLFRPQPGRGGHCLVGRHRAKVRSGWRTASVVSTRTERPPVHRTDSRDFRRVVLGLFGAAFMLGGWPALADSPLSSPYGMSRQSTMRRRSRPKATAPSLHRLLEVARAEEQPGTGAGAPPAGVTQDEILEQNHLLGRTRGST